LRLTGAKGKGSSVFTDSTPVGDSQWVPDQFWFGVFFGLLALLRFSDGYHFSVGIKRKKESGRNNYIAKRDLIFSSVSFPSNSDARRRNGASHVIP
jgi:hypothetical protein